MPYKNSQDKLKSQRNRRLKPLPDEAPKIEAPKIEAPKIEAPKIEAPAHNLTGLSNLISDPKKRKKLDAIIQSFKSSNNPDYAQAVRLGPDGPTLYEIGKLYE